MKRKLLATLLSLSMMISVLPAAAFAVEPPDVTELGDFIYTNGYDILIEDEDDDGECTISIDGTVVYTGDLSDKMILGGSADDVVERASITVNSGDVGAIYAGGSVIITAEALEFVTAMETVLSDFETAMSAAVGLSDADLDAIDHIVTALEDILTNFQEKIESGEVSGTAIISLLERLSADITDVIAPYIVETGADYISDVVAAMLAELEADLTGAVENLVEAAIEAATEAVVASVVEIIFTELGLGEITYDELMEFVEAINAVTEAYEAWQTAADEFAAMMWYDFGYAGKGLEVASLLGTLTTSITSLQETSAWDAIGAVYPSIDALTSFDFSNFSYDDLTTDIGNLTSIVTTISTITSALEGLSSAEDLIDVIAVLEDSDFEFSEEYIEIILNHMELQFNQAFVNDYVLPIFTVMQTSVTEFAEAWASGNVDGLNSPEEQAEEMLAEILDVLADEYTAAGEIYVEILEILDFTIIIDLATSVLDGGMTLTAQNVEDIMDAVYALIADSEAAAEYLDGIEFALIDSATIVVNGGTVDVIYGGGYGAGIFVTETEIIVNDGTVSEIYESAYPIDEIPTLTQLEIPEYVIAVLKLIAHTADVTVYDRCRGELCSPAGLESVCGRRRASTARPYTRDYSSYIT